MVDLTDRDIDLAARTILAEGGDPVATAHVIRNRAFSGKYGNTVANVVLRPYAFEPWLYAGKGTIKNDPLGYSADSPQYAHAREIINHVFAGNIPDPTKGATHFLQEDLQRSQGRKIPIWAQTQPIAQIGPHKYYAPEGAVKVASTDDNDEDWFEASAKKFTGHMAPKDAQPAAPAAPDPDDWFEQSRQKFTGHMAPDAKPPEDYLAAPEPPGPTQWGPGRAFMRGMTLGAEPYLEAALMHPIESLKHPLTPVAEIPGAGEHLRKLQEDQKLYAQQNPIQNALLEGSGALIGTAFPMGAAERAIVGSGKALGAAVPALKAPLESVGRFVGGRALEKSSSPWAYAGRPFSHMTQGTVQGAGAGLLSHGLTNTEGQGADESTLRGAIGGAITAPFINPLLGRAIAPFQAEMEEPIRQLALSANKKFGLNIRPTQITRDADLKSIDKQLPHYVNDAQVVKFAEETAKQAGVRGPLTTSNVDAHMRDAGDAMARAASATTMRPTRAFVRKMQDIENDVYSRYGSGDKMRKKIDVFMKDVYDDIAAGGGNMDGTKFSSLVGYNGRINNAFLKKDPRLAKELRNSFFDLFQANDPALHATYDAARQSYHKLATIKPLTSDSGLINPKSLLGRVQRKHITGDMEELARAGQYLPEVTSTGEAKAAKMTGKDWVNMAKDWALSGATVLGPLGVGGVGTTPAVGAALLSGGLAGAQYAGGGLRNYMMHNPMLVNSVLGGATWPTQVAQGANNVLSRGAGMGYAGAGWGWGQ